MIFDFQMMPPKLVTQDLPAQKPQLSPTNVILPRFEKTASDLFFAHVVTEERKNDVMIIQEKKVAEALPNDFWSDKDIEPRHLAAIVQMTTKTLQADALYLKASLRHDDPVLIGITNILNSDPSTHEKLLRDLQIEIIATVQLKLQRATDFFRLNTQQEHVVRGSPAEILDKVSARSTLWQFYCTFFGHIDVQALGAELGLNTTGDTAQQELSINPSDLASFQTQQIHFDSHFIDDHSLRQRFHDTILRMSRKWMRSKYFAPYTVLVQSSGCGKTRMLREIGNMAPTVFICFRGRESTGFPLRSYIADYLGKDIYAFLKANNLIGNIGLSDLVVPYYLAFFTACFREYRNILL